MPGSPKPSSSSSFDAFKKVDELVSKPVLGSDGANSWQSFRKDLPAKIQLGSVAPKAPLKKADRLGTGLSSWEEERKLEKQIRKDAGHADTGSGYTVFKKKGNDEEAVERKRKARIEARIRPEDVDYFLPAKAFEGWKFDYIFTTRNNGTGYYWDGMDSVKKESGELTDEPSTSERKSKDPGSISDKKGEEEAGKPKKKKRKKSVGPVIVHDPNNPLEQVHAIIHRRNQMMGGGNAPLPIGWEIATDPVSQNQYYFNRTTGERSWEKPKDSSTVNDETIKLDSTAGRILEPLPQGWKSAIDSTTGKTYYYHAQRGETRWEKPT